MTNDEPNPRNEEIRLDSWKAIAAHLKRDVRTVRRWEKLEGLPVHRHLHQAQSTVYAYPSEINAWSATRQPRREEVAAWRRPIPALAFAAVLMLSLLLVADAPYSTYAAAAQRVPGQSGMTSRRVWTLPQDGTFDGTISADGRFLSYPDTATDNLVVHEFATGRDRLITNAAGNGDYAFRSLISRNGKQVAYSWYRGDTGRGELRVASLEGTGLPQSQLLFANEDVTDVKAFDWSPDGNWIAVQLERKDRTGQIGLISVRDGSLRVLKSAEWRYIFELYFSPDGQYLAFDLPVGDNQQRDVFILAVDGSGEIPAAMGPTQDSMMGWSPDGKHLLFASERGGTVGLWAVTIADGRPQGPPELIKSDITPHSQGLSASGSLYYGVLLGGRDIHVASVDLETGKLVGELVRPVQSFVGSNAQPDWSPDGKYLAYISNRRQTSIDRVLAIQFVETGQVREFRPKLSNFQRLRWAPDGRSLLFQGTDRKGRQGAYRIDAQTGEVRAIAVSEPGGGLSWPQSSQDGRKVYYRKGAPDSMSLVERDLASGNEREIIRRNSLGAPSLSSDGRFIATTYNDGATKSSVVLLIPVSGGEPRELLRVSQPQSLDQFVAWMPDGRAVLVNKSLNESGDQRELWLVPTAGGQPRKIDIGAAWFGGPIKVHPDGRQITFMAGENNSKELWVLENFLPALKAAK